MVLRIDSLVKVYGQQRAVDHISLHIAAGQVFGLLGPNGSGKTSTLAMVLGVVRPDKGVYRWFGESGAARFRRRVGALLEKPNFCPWLSGLQNLKITGLIRQIPKLDQAVTKALQQVGLQGAGTQAFAGYSLGMKQRLAIAAALLGEPEVLVLDEPTNGIDAEGIREIRELIKNYAEAGKTVILASHILDEVEKVCSHVAILQKGRVLQTGAIDEVLSADDWVEVGASDLAALEQALASIAQVLRIEKNTQTEKNRHFLRVQLDKDFSLAACNQALAAKGVYVEHLNRRKQSLESHFFELLEKS